MKEYIKVLSCDRVKDEFIVRIDNNCENYKIFYNETADIKDKNNLLLESNQSEIRFKDPIMGKRTYFVIEMDGYNDEIFAESKLPLKGCCNFRDLGGFVTKDNRRVKWNKFYRADALNLLKDEDLEYLKSVALKIIFDYRGIAEANNDMDVEIEGSKYINIPAMDIEEKNSTNQKFDFEFIMKQAKNIPALDNPIKFIADGYEKMPFDNKAFKKMIDILIEEEIPFVQHCKSGKDRTGAGSALILLLLGVSLEDVKNDYMASNSFRKEYNEATKKRYAKVLSDKNIENLFSIILEVKEEYFDAFIDAIMKKYNSFDEYFEKEYDLDANKINELKDKYLY